MSLNYSAIVAPLTSFLWRRTAMRCSGVWDKNAVAAMPPPPSPPPLPMREIRGRLLHRAISEVRAGSREPNWQGYNVALSLIDRQVAH